MTDDKKEKDVIRPFEVDGIKEYDNPMPRWWLTLFYGCIVFAVIYMIVVHGFGLFTLSGELIADREHAAKKVQMAQTSSDSEQEQSIDDQIEAGLQDAQVKAQGKEVYDSTCSPCHGAQGQGVVGPNLTDKFWLHGGEPEQILNSIAAGIPEKGMPAWSSVLGPKKVMQLAVYVVSLKNTNVPNGKAPEGSEESE